MELSTLFRLDNKVIIITGGAGFLGKMHAEAVAAFGGIPVLLDISESALRKTEEEINSNYNIVSQSYVVDITNENAVIDNVKEVLEKYGRIDGLINNASNNPKIEEGKNENFSRLENFPLETWNQDFAVGLTGAFLCAKHYGFEMSRNDTGGSIVNISSDLGIISPDQRLYSDKKLKEHEQLVKPVSYSVVKTGLLGLTRYLATYWPKKVRCNAICPGGVENGQPKEFLENVRKLIPMDRLAHRTELQGSLVFLLSNASSYMNGSILVVDGGRSVL